MNLYHIIPHCLALNPNQQKILAKFIEDNEKEFKKSTEANIEEDCCGGGAVHFEIRTSGIGESVTAVMGEHRIWLDDGFET